MVATEFKQKQFNSIYPEGVEGHYWTLARNKIIKRKLVRNSLINKKILEIGCGRGIVVNFLRQSGFDCYGVDLAVVEPVKGVKKYIKTGVGFESLDKIFANSVEVVMLLDVIEHVENVTDFIRNIKKKFPNLMCIFVTVPARQELFSNYDVHYGHHRRYDLPDLMFLCSECNLRMRGFSYFFHLLYLPAGLFSLLGIKRSVDVFPPKGIMILIERIVALFFFIEQIVLPKKLLGTSAFCFFYDK